MPDLLFEIGCEELPPGSAPTALLDLSRLARERLAESRLAHGEVRALGTPRRLALIVRDVAEAPPAERRRISGPPVTAGERAAEGFARKLGLPRASLVEIDGRHTAEFESVARPARETLPALLRGLIGDLEWVKPMRWADHDETFARPVLWIVALFGGEVVPLEFAGVRAGRETRGHRFCAPQPLPLSTEPDYEAVLRSAHVEPDPDLRRSQIAAQLEAAATAAGLRVRPDRGLLDEVTWLVEEPVIVVGTFGAAHLRLPEPMVVSAMRKHQRYFALTDASGRLANRFAAVAGTHVRDLDVVRRGYERVLAARLADARFFFEEDRRTGLTAMAGKLGGVVFQQKLGTIADKVGRLEALGDALARRMGADADRTRHAARLAKADLVSRAVYEFPDLQGVIGGIYARAEGEEPEVADAIGEHYLPRFSGDTLPRTPTGAVLAIADRLDTLVGIFGVGLQPTGSADPYGLRRAAIGLCRIVVDRGWRGSLRDLVAAAAASHGGRFDATAPKVVEFVLARFRGMLAEEFPTDLVAAALEAGGDDLCDLRARVAALAEFRKRADWEPLAVAFKRVANILKSEVTDGAPDEAAFHEPAERNLWHDVRAIDAERVLEAGYPALLERLAAVRPAVDRFFDDVLVMDENLDVRRNRLALLGRLNALFRRVADFRQV